MKNNYSSSTKEASRFLGLLTLLFIGLKLAGFIDWSWVWVLAPAWLPMALALIVLGVLLLRERLKKDRGN